MHFGQQSTMYRLCESLLTGNSVPLHACKNIQTLAKATRWETRLRLYSQIAVPAVK